MFKLNIKKLFHDTDCYIFINRCSSVFDNMTHAYKLCKGILWCHEIQNKSTRCDPKNNPLISVCTIASCCSDFQLLSDNKHKANVLFELIRAFKKESCFVKLWLDCSYSRLFQMVKTWFFFGVLILFFDFGQKYLTAWNMSIRIRHRPHGHRHTQVRGAIGS